VLPLLNACIRTFTTSMGFVVAVAHATEMPDTNIGSAKEYAEEEEEEEDDNDVEFSRRSRSLLIRLRAFPKWKSHLCCIFTIHKNTRETLGDAKNLRRRSLAGEKRDTHTECVKERERERKEARGSLSLSLSVFVKKNSTFGTFWEASENTKIRKP